MIWPQIAIIVLFGAAGGIALVNHGKYKGDSYNFWWTLLSIGVEGTILVYGGFFDVFLK